MQILLRATAVHEGRVAQEEVNATELLIPLVDDSLLAGKSLQEIRDRAERVSALVVAAAEKAVARLQP